MDGPSDVERRQLQTLCKAVERVALDSRGVVHPPSEQQALDQEFVWQETSKLRVRTLLRLPLWLLKQNHHHIDGEQPVHHLQKPEQQTYTRGIH